MICSLLLVTFLILSGCSSANTNSPKGELLISAAASLTDALKDIQTLYETRVPDVRLTFNFGSSGALQQQIEQGAPADLFLSAAPKNMKALLDKQLIESSKTLLTNELVVVVPADSQANLTGLADLGKPTIRNLAIGIPDSVPAGQYAKEALLDAKLWDSISSKTVQGKDVRQVLQYVETGNVDAGFVYKTDARSSSTIKIAFIVDPKSYTPIEYPVGIMKASPRKQAAEHFYTFLQSKEAIEIFRKHGFSTLK